MSAVSNEKLSCGLFCDHGAGQQFEPILMTYVKANFTTGAGSAPEFFF
jgi:hypothetical protein